MKPQQFPLLGEHPNNLLTTGESIWKGDFYGCSSGVLGLKKHHEQEQGWLFFSLLAREYINPWG